MARESINERADYRGSNYDSVATILDLMTVTAASQPYRREIDGLRAFAVLAVILNHFDKRLLPSG